MLLILAEYPDNRTQYEGMSQRVMAIDRLCATHQRIYLFVSHRRFWTMARTKLSDNVVQYRCNSLAHGSFIRKLFKQADTCYFHSVINVLPLLPFLPFIPRNTNVVLDVHGVVPEESLYAGYKFKSKLYGLAERRIFARVDKVIAVSDTMTCHFRQKYSQWQGPATIYPILPAHIDSDADELVTEPDKTGVVHVIYSGNLQSWQNIDLMLSLIKQHRADNMKFWILTGQREAMLRRIEDAGISLDERLTVLTVSPDELKTYYRIAHYGFILRDDMIINRVSCPTKLVEYLHAGIVPVVCSPKIGDFEQMGFEYLRFADFNANLPIRKSEINRRLMESYIANVRAMDFAKLIANE